ncbi:MAG: hypothetical protein HY351_05270 [Candidatus Omnitrophica bacterium]|nr:hypothetical protein [Candidatus Omnitrophota bacterium]
MFTTLIITLMLINIFIPDAPASSNKEDGNNKVRTFIIGAPKAKGPALAQSMEKEEIYFNYVNTGRKLFEKKDYAKALSVLLKGYQYANINKIHAWNLHWGLADVYEAMGKKNEFLKEVDWLISKSRSEKTTQEFIERKQKFLELHP